MPGRWKPSTKTYIAEMFALKCTELPDAIIDACGAGISLGGISVATDMTEVKPGMHSALTVEKSNPPITEVAGESSHMAEWRGEIHSEWTVKFAGSQSCAGFGRKPG